MLQPSLPGALPFPEGFMWGAATAAHQVEGGLVNDWQAFEATPGTVHGGDTSAIAVDHFRRYDQDFALAAGMGHNAHRLSLEWARLEPERGRYDPQAVAHYRAVLGSLRRRGLTPMVTLHHFTNPQWVADQGGWLADRTIEDFARYAAFAGSTFGDDVGWWVTINEPNVYAFQAYDDGVWPPQRRNRAEALRVMANLARAHARAYHALHEAGPTRVGVAQHVAVFEPYCPLNPIDHLKVRFVDDVFNRSFLRAITTGELRFEVPGVPGVRGREPLASQGAVDFIGVNYYTRWLYKAFGTPDRVAKADAPKNDLGWEIYPEGLYRALELADAYTRLPDGRRVPLVVTENGMDDRAGDRRADFLVRHLEQVARAIADGLDVRGYMHWTLMDNFEWHEGYAPRFGLYRVDRENDLARVPTPAVAVYRAIAEANAIPAALRTPDAR